MFLSTEHEKQYKNFLQMDNTAPDDRERKAMFYILAGSPDLRSKGIKTFYDFSEHMLHINGPENLEEVEGRLCLCSSSRALLRLALNLYNNSYPSLSFTDTFWNLDKDNYKLVMQALRLRFEPSETCRRYDVEAAEEDFFKAEEEDRINRGMAEGLFTALNRPVIEGEYD